MTYEIALQKAWNELAGLTSDKTISLKFLADEYAVDLEHKSILSLSCNAPVKEFSAVLLLHYLVRKSLGLPALSGEWLTFRELAGIEGYFPAFRKRAIEPVIRKYGSNPEGILSALERLPSKKADFKDISIIIDAFEGVPVLLKVFKADEEFGPDANILFDRSVTKIFAIEDIIVLAGIIGQSL